MILRGIEINQFTYIRLILNAKLRGDPLDSNNVLSPLTQTTQFAFKITEFVYKACLDFFRVGKLVSGRGKNYTKPKRLCETI